MTSSTQPILTAGDYSSERYRCEYLVVGTGAGGSVAGALLAEAGHDVILLEEGGYHPLESLTTNISDMMALLYRNRGIFPFLGAPVVPFAEGCCVGGGTTINGALVWRAPHWLLDEWRDDYGLKGYGNADLAKHFETIERDLHVVRHELEDDANLDSLYLLRGAEELGWKTCMVPRAVVNCRNENLCPIGCPSSAKQCTLLNYIPRALKSGARLFSNCRAIKIVHSNGIARKVVAKAIGSDNPRTIEIDFDYLVVAGGAVQTPHLLRRSRIARLAGRNLHFHMNLKIVALFKDKLHAERGTIFTVQVQEFDREGLLIMPSTMAPHFAVTTLAHHGNEAVDHMLENYLHSAIFVAMIRPESKAHIISSLGDQPVVWYWFNPRDLPRIKVALRRAAELLFQSGAVELYMPISGSGAVRSLADLDRKLERLKPNQLEIITVHVMASCPMGPNPATSVVGPDGRLWNMKNVLLADASILPSSTGESPQGTIMAFVHEVMSRHIYD